MPLPLTVPAAAPTRLGEAEHAAVADAIARVVADGQWIGGAPVEKFESEFASYLGASEVVGVGNGTDALAVAFTALELPRGSGILIAANEGGYAASAARQAGLEPIVMDLDAQTLMPTVATAGSVMIESVAAIVVTHLHGDAVDLEALDSWRRSRGLRLIEDCAQAAGLRTAGAHVGLVGDAATFSFYPTKNLAAIGDGGAIAFGDAALAARARVLAQYGWTERYRIGISGGRNSRLDSLQAAVLSARLPFLNDRNLRRRAISARYRETLAPVAQLYGDAATTVAHHAVVISDDRDALTTHLLARGVQSARHYPYLVGDMPGLAMASQAPAPAAAKLRDQSLSLPCFPELTENEINRVLSACEEWVNVRV
jgi:dTDP-3-amino-2,3,6-trideoxy-4-keto-D-glucose/dTDP-3-amino-3,4,6-trideoxy-alpha-D-glucose/dTDP-2,6-dideoxy-D-kanosamine transaminase